MIVPAAHFNNVKPLHSALVLYNHIQEKKERKKKKKNTPCNIPENGMIIIPDMNFSLNSH